jgi:hypothetical protein
LVLFSKKNTPFFRCLHVNQIALSCRGPAAGCGLARHPPVWQIADDHQQAGRHVAVADNAGMVHGGPQRLFEIGRLIGTGAMVCRHPDLLWSPTWLDAVPASGGAAQHARYAKTLDLDARSGKEHTSRHHNRI